VVEENHDFDEKKDRDELEGEETETRTEWAEQRTEWAEQRTEWANERTDWAQHRTVLANERTFSAWTRTGISAVAGGIAVARFLGQDDDSLLPRVLGTILVIIGAGVLGLAIWRYTTISDVMEKEGLPVMPKWAAYALSFSLLLASVLVLTLIFIQ
jgi:putative membrane protein